MRKEYSYFFIFILICLFASCKNGTETPYYEDSSGPINLVSVFSSTETYNNIESGLRDSLVFGKIFPGLYYPPEIMFGTRHFDAELIKRFKTTRLILDVKSGNSSIDFEKNKFAKPQAYVKVTGNSPEEILHLLQQNQDSLINFYRWADREFMLADFRSKSKQDKKDLDALGVNMVIPNDYTLVENNADFVWYRKDNFNTIQNVDERDNGIVTDRSQDILNILLFKVPYAKDEITQDEAYNLFDSITKLYTKGGKNPKEVYVQTNGGQDSIKTLMTDHIQIEKNPMLSEFYDFQKVSSSAQQDIYETKGWWSMTLSQLGGPFTSKIILDKNKNVLYVADAIMFAPTNQGVSKKRDYITGMESLFTTFKTKE